MIKWPLFVFVYFVKRPRFSLKLKLLTVVFSQKIILISIASIIVVFWRSSSITLNYLFTYGVALNIIYRIHIRQPGFFVLKNNFMQCYGVILRR